MAKFKKGDRVKFIGEVGNGSIGGDKLTIGEIVTIDEDNSDNPFFYRKGQIQGTARSCGSEVCFELVKDTPKPKFKVRPEQKFSVGDRVRVLRNEYHGHKIGHIGVITDDEETSCGKKAWIIDDSWYNAEDELELVEEGCNSCEVDEDDGEELDFIVEDEAFDAQATINYINKYYKAFNEPSNSSGNKVGKIMSKVSEFVKNSLLSKEEKLLRKYDLKDSCGDYTMHAKNLVVDKLTKDNEAYLIEVATAMEAEKEKAF